jgi:hypothetical protein
VRKHCTSRKYEVMVKKVENKTVCSKQMVECPHLTLWPLNQRRVYCHTATPELNWRITIDQVPISATQQRIPGSFHGTSLVFHEM